MTPAEASLRAHDAYKAGRLSKADYHQAAATYGQSMPAGERDAMRSTLSAALEAIPSDSEEAMDAFVDSLGMGRRPPTPPRRPLNPIEAALGLG